MIAFWIFVAIMIGLTFWWGIAAWRSHDRLTAAIVLATSVSLAVLSIAAAFAAS